MHIGLWCTCLSGFVGCLGVHVEICVSVYIGLEVCSCMCLGLVNQAFLLFQCVCLIESDCVFVCLFVCLPVRVELGLPLPHSWSSMPQYSEARCLPTGKVGGGGDTHFN